MFSTVPTTNKGPADTEKVWKIQGSRESRDCYNAMRQCTEVYFVEALKQCDKKLYKLAIGDPSIFGNLKPHQAVHDAVKAALDSGFTAGYSHSLGHDEARKAVAKQFSTDEHPLTMQDIVMTVGATGALDMCFGALCNPGQCILLPKPCYSIYRCLLDARGIQIKYYQLLEMEEWRVDLEDLERQIDSNTSAILINNPSNPCGSVYSRQHICDILAVADRHKVPVISDEIYANMVFKGKEFHSVGSVSKTVPVLTCGGISKRYLVPGWRSGWLIVHDKQGILQDDIKPGLFRMSTKWINSCLLIQAAIPDIFRNVPCSFYDETMEIFESNAKSCYSKLASVPGLHPVMPSGALYMMIGIEMEHFPEFKDDIAFMNQLIVEQSVMCVPGTVFQYPGAMRIALIMPQQDLTIACNRIQEFCGAHFK